MHEPDHQQAPRTHSLSTSSPALSCFLHDLVARRQQQRILNDIDPPLNDVGVQKGLIFSLLIIL